MLGEFDRSSSIDTLEWVNCALCGPAKTMVFSGQAPYRLVRCNHCGLVFMNPRPRYMGMQGLDTKERLEFLIQEHRRVRNLWCRECLSWVQRYATQGRLLDIGCSAGFFLSIAREAGWGVDGIEPSEVMAQYGQKLLGLPITVGPLDSKTLASFELRSYDAVTMWEVLEHLPNPLSAVELVWKLLKPGGIIFIQVPNIESPVFKLFHGRWHNLSIHNHLTFFSSTVLRALLERCGYDVKYVFTHSHIYRNVGPWRFRGIPIDSDSRLVRGATMVFNHLILKIMRSGDQIVAIARKIA